jgi:hypothetical protein
MFSLDGLLFLLTIPFCYWLFYGKKDFNKSPTIKKTVVFLSLCLLLFITNPQINGQKWTPTRKVVEKAASFIEVPHKLFAIVAIEDELSGIFVGDCAAAWEKAAHRRRILMVVLILGTTLLASSYMADVMPHKGTTALELTIVIVFGALFAWISIGVPTA